MANMKLTLKNKIKERRPVIFQLGKEINKSCNDTAVQTLIKKATSERAVMFQTIINTMACRSLGKS
jgi:hypothetical protein